LRLRLIDRTGRALCKIGSEVLRRNGIEGTWIDVGAHNGEYTLGHALHNPGLRIYALEPNLRAAATLVGRAPNFVVVPMAVAEQDGCAKFFINAYEMASSMLPLNEEGLRSWIGGDALKVDSVVTVPTIRLDTLMNLLEINKVNFLKIDTQGMDLAVLKSAGRRLRDIEKITLEVAVAAAPQYIGAPTKNEVLSFLDQADFQLIGSEKQTHDQEENLTFVRRG
jgi:FkbM family methyltransferase